MSTEKNLKITFNLIEDDFPSLTKTIKEYEKHCVTYLIHNNKQVYIGESSNFIRRIKDHGKSDKKKHQLIKTKIITSQYFNKSAVYDLETKLINYMYADNRFEILNIKTNQNSHEYFMKKEINDSLFKNIWRALKQKGIVRSDLNDLENSDLFKLSPFKEFSDEQIEIIDNIINSITYENENKEELISFDGSTITKRHFKEENESILVSGGPGTGKSLLIVKLVHILRKKYLLTDANIAICIPQSSLRRTLKNMLRLAKIKVKVIKPIDMSKDLETKYDLLIIDEAHRLKQHFNKQAKDLKHLEEGKYTELDFAHKKSKHLVLMFDSNQTVRPADLNIEDFSIDDYKSFQLTQQFRVKEGANYLRFIESILQINSIPPNHDDLGDYNLKVVNNLTELHEVISKKNNKHGHCRMGAGYDTPWRSKKDKSLYDFSEGELKLQWNNKIEGWVQRPESQNEIGCIHTLQGQDLNYAGIIIGDDIYLDPKDNQIKVNKDKYNDKNGTPINGTDESSFELTKYIKNIYYVLLTRGMLGTYIYIKDPNLKKYIKKILS